MDNFRNNILNNPSRHDELVSVFGGKEDFQISSILRSKYNISDPGEKNAAAIDIKAILQTKAAASAASNPAPVKTPSGSLAGSASGSSAGSTNTADKGKGKVKLPVGTKDTLRVASMPLFESAVASIATLDAATQAIVTAATDVHSEAVTKIKKLASDKKFLETQVETKRQEVLQVQAKLDTTNAQLNQMVAVVVPLTAKCNQLEADLALAQGAVVDANLQVATRDQRITDLEDEIIQLRDQIAIVEQEKVQLDNKRAALELEKQTLEAEKATLVGEKAALEAEKVALQADKAALEAQIVDLVNDNTGYIDFTDRLQAKLDKKDEKLQNLRLEHANCLSAPAASSSVIVNGMDSFITYFQYLNEVQNAVNAVNPGSFTPTYLDDTVATPCRRDFLSMDTFNLIIGRLGTLFDQNSLKKLVDFYNYMFQAIKDGYIKTSDYEFTLSTLQTIYDKCFDEDVKRQNTTTPIADAFSPQYDFDTDTLTPATAPPAGGSGSTPALSAADILKAAQLAAGVTS
jgi:hypothetical protein